jgi:hypothetical protein
MGNRDFGKGEKKKPKKDAKKGPMISSGIIEPRPEVEVIKKGKKKQEDW